MTLERRLMAEWLGTFSLLATVIGSGIMAERLADGNVAIALLGNTIPTGAILVVLITIFGPISGAHFNPAVTLCFAIRREIEMRDAGLYVAVQIFGGIIAKGAKAIAASQGADGRNIPLTDARDQTKFLDLPYIQKICKKSMHVS